MPASSPVLSVFDLVPISAGRTGDQALAEMTGLARTADACGYHRYWIAEHHGSTTYLAAATTVLMGQVLAATERIGVASGGIMLPNHSPLVVAEQIGTLARLYPGRVGLGLGRAPGTDPLTASALHRRAADPRSFAQDVLQTLTYLGRVSDDVPATVPGSLTPLVAGADGEAQEPPAPVGRARAVVGEGTAPEPWVLGSSVNGARVAGALGLPFAVASHFAPAQAEAAIVSYRSVFDASCSVSLDGRPHVAAVVNAMVAPTEAEARFLFTTAMAAAARVIGGRPAPLDPPSEDLSAWRRLVPGQETAVEQAMAMSFVGTADDVAARLRALAERWGLEEVLVVSHAHDAHARRRSYELLASAWGV
ncbi:MULTISPECIES: LLM class flavin-dependent oxidoreductase [Actinomyces]|uniref:LLM class flavin-dependent oxidoreductase n=1 Tax=Actinomyces respiraculi TaxID=2744574 RepID=A0A7T0LLU7_9ACTO|nr:MULTISPECIES: LLM class flavin-dependent oxidoreductase [Actinomyces]QPL05728.1 LLM class flavin-dependent oxidoreductase [Actinomyces respiraculi]